MEPIPEVEIHRVTWRPEKDGLLIEIAYTELRDAGANAFMTKIIMVNPSILNEDDYRDVMESLQGWIDAGLIDIRNPPDEIR